MLSDSITFEIMKKMIDNFFRWLGYVPAEKPQQIRIDESKYQVEILQSEKLISGADIMQSRLSSKAFIYLTTKQMRYDLSQEASRYIREVQIDESAINPYVQDAIKIRMQLLVAKPKP